MNPAVDIVAALTGQTVGSVSLTSGTNLFVGEMPTEDLSPSPCVSVLNTGGLEPEPYMQGTRLAYYHGAVQLTVRGAPGTFAAGETLAIALVGFLQQRTLSGYVAAFCRESLPTYLGREEAQRPLWSLNVELQWEA